MPPKKKAKIKAKEKAASSKVVADDEDEEEPQAEQEGEAVGDQQPAAADASSAAASGAGDKREAGDSAGSAASAPPAKKAKTEKRRMNLNEVVCKGYETWSLSRLADAPVSALQGVGAQAETFMRKLRIKTVRDLADWKFFRAASAITVLAPLEVEGKRPEDSAMNMNQILCQAYETKSLQEILEAKPSALQGLAAMAEKTLAGLHIKTVGQLGEWKYARWAEYIVTLAGFEDHKDEKPTDPKSAVEEKAAEQAKPAEEPDTVEAEMTPADGEDALRPAEEAKPAEEARPMEAADPKSITASSAEAAKQVDEREPDTPVEADAAFAEQANQADEREPETPADASPAEEAKPQDEREPETPAAAYPAEEASPEEAMPQTPERLEELGAPRTPEELGAPRTPGEDDEPLLPKDLSKAAPDAGSGEAADAGGEDDIWKQLEDEVAKPLLEEDAEPAQADEPDDASDWGVEWDDEQEQPQKTNVLEEIEQVKKQAQEAAGEWHKEKWAKKKEEDVKADERKGDADEDEGGAWEDWADRYKRDEEEKREAENWVYDSLWTGWSSNSKEAKAAEETMRKIRGRTQKPRPKIRDADGLPIAGEGAAAQSTEPLEDFPSPGLLSRCQDMLLGTNTQHKLLLAALIWVEANTVEVKDLPSDLSSSTLVLMEQEKDTLLQLQSRVPSHVLLKKADSHIPKKDIRERAVETIKTLTQALREQLEKTSSRPGGAKLELDEEDGKDAIAAMVEDMLGEQPRTIQIMALIHACEMQLLRGSQRADLDSLAATFSKQSLLEKAMETVCRLSLEDAIVLALQSRDEESKSLRQKKFDALNRLYVLWKLSPLEEQLAQLHLLSLSRQLQVLLGIERDIELFWYKLSSSRSKTREEQNKELRTFLDFDNLMASYILENDLAVGHHHAILEDQGGLKVSTSMLASIRQGTSDVLKMLKKKYQWTPGLATKREISRTNWVARLASTLRLASKNSCLFADEELRKMLREDGHKKLGSDVYVEFQQWYKLEGKSGLKMSRQKIVDDETYAEIQEKIRSWAPDSQRYPVQEGPTPATPANLGAGGMTPGLGMATPGLSQGLGTPALGTPGGSVAGSLNLTPQYRPGGSTPLGPAAAGTPAGPPPATPGLPGGQKNYRPPGTPSGPPPATPGFRTQPSTPAGPPPATPGFSGAPPGTPAGPPPATPGFASKPPGTPMGVPPMTPAGPAAAGSPGVPPGSTTPGAPAGMPQTPGNPAPFTPGGAAAATGSRSGRSMPMTPGQAVPFTPGGPAPSTAASARSMPMTPGNAVPFTPGGPAPATAGMHRGMPMTPGAAVPYTPAGPAPSTAASNRSMPMTPSNAVPFTPGGPPPKTSAGATAPQTPAGAGTFTPGGPAPTTAGGLAAPMTPFGAFAAAGIAPRTGSAPPAAAAATTAAPQTPLAALQRR